MSVLLAACLTAPTALPPATPTESVADFTPPAPDSATAAPAASVTLRLWLTPGFESAAEILQSQLAAFEQAHPGWRVEVRLKPAGGPGSLRAALEAAANAAPNALPDVALLNQDDLALTAAAGLLQPLDFAPPEMLADYYPFAQALARQPAGWVSLPVAANPRLLAYRSDLHRVPPQRWSDLTAGTLAAPLDETSGLTVLHEYLALGGLLAGPSGAPVLDTEILTDVLTEWAALRQDELLSRASLTYSGTARAWQVFRERRASLAVTDARQFLQERNRVLFSAAAPIPSGAGAPFALTEAWAYGLTAVTPERQALAAELLLWLAEPGRQAEWCQAAQLLPARVSALAAWGADGDRFWAETLLLNARLAPPAATLEAVGPLLRHALGDVLESRATPFAAALAASQAVAGP